MVKLDLTVLRYLTRDDFRVLTAVEMGMKNHELVSLALVKTIASLKNANVSKILHQLTQHKLVSYERGKRYDGYRLTYLGYDYLALNALANRQVLASVGNQIGVGKESDVFVASNHQHQQMVIKLHRLGRTCFRKVTLKRDYLRSGHKTNWIYLSRLAALREFAFMKVLHEKGFPVPQPFDSNRHCVVMQLIEGTLLNQITREDIQDVAALYDKLINLIIKLANEYGVVHGDFNEFNILITNETLEPVLIDFPQMISVTHANAQAYFERDVGCIINFFAKRFGFESDQIPEFEIDVRIDVDENKSKLEQFNHLIKETIEGEGGCDDVLLDENPVENESSFQQIGTVQDQASLIKDVATDEIGVQLNSLMLKTSEHEESDSSVEMCAATTTASTFSPIEIKSRLRNERKRVDKRRAVRLAAKSSKGSSNAVIRKRKEDLARVCDDLKAYKLDGV